MTDRCTCNLEPSFMTVETNGDNGEDGWDVCDAECEPVAHCKIEKHAQLIARALNEMKSTCLVHETG